MTEEKNRANFESLLFKVEDYEKEIKQIHDENSNLIHTLQQQQKKTVEPSS